MGRKHSDDKFTEYMPNWMPDGLCFSDPVLWEAHFVATFTEKENINEAERIQGVTRGTVPFSVYNG